MLLRLRISLHSVKSLVYALLLRIRRLFSDAVSNVASIGWMIVNNESESICKEMVVA
jgi:hypothetical protein